MNEQYNGKLISNAKSLRKAMTKEERHLWFDCLKQLPMTVHRQKVLGNYIVDFYIASVKIVIELDGSQHYEAEYQKKDAQRDAYLQRIGCRVLRYSNADVNQRFRSVCEDIWNHVMQQSLLLKEKPLTCTTNIEENNYDLYHQLPRRDRGLRFCLGEDHSIRHHPCLPW